MGLDTMHSDHDIFLHIKDGDEHMVELLYEERLEGRYPKLISWQSSVSQGVRSQQACKKCTLPHASRGLRA